MCTSKVVPFKVRILQTFKKTTTFTLEIVLARQVVITSRTQYIDLHIINHAQFHSIHTKYFITILYM